MASGRIRGQDALITVTQNGTLLTQLTNIRSFEIGVMMDIQEEGYVGETADQFDEVYNGMRGRFEVHPKSASFLNFILSLIARARRRDPSLQFNITVTLQFPNGDRPRVILRDVAFGEVPLGAGGRKEFVGIGLEFRCTDLAVL